MSAHDGEYAIELARDAATISGVLRLVSPPAYRRAFAGIHEALDACTETFTLDVRGLTFVNSSGITGLSRLVMLARSKSIPMVCVVDIAVPWQRKTLPSLRRLYPRFELRTADGAEVAG